MTFNPASVSRAAWVAAIVVAILGGVAALVVGVNGAVIAYVFVLIAGTGLLTTHRIIEGRRSRDPSQALPPRLLRRIGWLPGLLIVIACVANAFVWATEVSKR